MFGALGGARNSTCMSFLSKAAIDAGVPEQIGLRNQIGTVFATRELRKADLVHNSYQPTIEVDPRTYEVRADGELLTCEPAAELPMAQRYFLF
jgi:urease subunit alpha